MRYTGWIIAYIWENKSCDISIITYILLIYNINDMIILILIYTKIWVLFKTWEFILIYIVDLCKYFKDQ